ncbi:glycoside hydrolase family protein [Klebsiella quasipneumoniae]|uniref:glycoside hydrolase family protein n=1 Tax=Klebsiella quasipneumoniae TaxID=1463165 RepID=UPI001CA3DD8A|nr:glycoside hydrolase family protein [Klebsiella quasipneumoniae]MBY8385113.1 glycoside hydrolase family protein [Klebsiella quasipneumoniae]
MSQIDKMLRADEGFSAVPYIDTQGYPTIGTGQRIGPKGASIKNYTFSISQIVSDAWMVDISDTYRVKLSTNSVISPAWNACDDVRKDALLNMAYQMGSSGLAAFTTTLSLIAKKQFQLAAENMLKSLWAKQTPNRAARVASVMEFGDYRAYKKWF